MDIADIEALVGQRVVVKNPSRPQRPIARGMLTSVVSSADGPVLTLGSQPLAPLNAVLIVEAE